MIGFVRKVYDLELAAWRTVRDLVLDCALGAEDMPPAGSWPDTTALDRADYPGRRPLGVVTEDPDRTGYQMESR
jgi:hypothetical protein